MLAGMLCFAACSDDDEDEAAGGSSSAEVNLNTPEFEGISGIYKVDNTGAGIESIEFTESGKYIIYRSSNYNVAPKRNTGNRFMRAARRTLTRGVDLGNMVVGDYTKIADNEYRLDGFGKIVVNQYDGNGFFKAFELTPDGETGIQLSVTKMESLSDSDKTKHLCRTWYMVSGRIQIYVNNVLVVEGSYDYATDKVTVTVDKLAEFEDENDYYPEEAEEIIRDAYDEVVDVTFSKSGTYLCHYIYTYGDSTSEYYEQSHWRWNNEAQGYLQYYWDDVMDDDWDAEGIVTVTFGGKNMYVSESYEDSEDGMSMRGVSYMVLESRD